MKDIKLLSADIETGLMGMVGWGPAYKTSISYDQLMEGCPPTIICLSYKWYGEDKVHTLVCDEDGNGEGLVNKWNELVSKADVVLAHNGENFDFKKLNMMRIVHQLEPIQCITQADTLRQIRNIAAFPSNRLDALCGLLFKERKLPMSYQSWVDIFKFHCLNRFISHLKVVKGSKNVQDAFCLTMFDEDSKAVRKAGKEALNKMVTYCPQDVLLLEKLAERIAPYVGNAGTGGNGAIMRGLPRIFCPNYFCDWNTPGRVHGYRHTHASEMVRLQCGGCGRCWTLPKKMRDNLMERYMDGEFEELR